MRLIDEQFLKTPFYGVRRMCIWLRSLGYAINKKRVRRLMQREIMKTLAIKGLEAN